MFRSLFVVVFASLGLLAACGGSGTTAIGNSSSGGSSSTSCGGTILTPATASGNVANIVVDAGPAALKQCGTPNVAYVTVKICAPGTTTCTTVDHVQVDTGSEGLRILAGALSSSFIAALPAQSNSSSNPVLECTQFVDGYVWGPVKKADFTIAGESVSSMPLQIIGASGYASVPSDCSSGMTSENTISTFGANGIIGIGPFPDDCGSNCAKSAASQALGGASYWVCPSSTCSLIEEDETGTASNLQVPNPVAKFATDNNGTMISIPSVPTAGQNTATGRLVFGIGTQTNNALGSSTVVYTIDSTNGLFTTIFAGNTFAQSYIDSGTSVLVFDDTAVTQCSESSDYYGFYCPSSTLSLSATNEGANSVTGVVDFSVGDPATMNGDYSVLPALAAVESADDAIGSTFAWGLPFFYGRNVYTAIDGLTTPGGTGPYFAY